MKTEHIGRAIPYLDTDHYIIVKGGWTDGSVPIPDELVGSVVQEEFFTWYSEVGNRQDIRDYDDLLKKYLALKEAYDKLVAQKLKKVKI